jgi:hypothetical protein
MTNKSKKTVAAMTFFQFEQKFPDEKAAIDYFSSLPSFTSSTFSTLR